MERERGNIFPPIADDDTFTVLNGNIYIIKHLISQIREEGCIAEKVPLTLILIRDRRLKRGASATRRQSALVWRERRRGPRSNLADVRARPMTTCASRARKGCRGGGGGRRQSVHDGPRFVSISYLSAHGPLGLARGKGRKRDGDGSRGPRATPRRYYDASGSFVVARRSRVSRNSAYEIRAVPRERGAQQDA
jgi:hypothetical protein